MTGTSPRSAGRVSSRAARRPSTYPRSGSTNGGSPPRHAGQTRPGPSCLAGRRVHPRACGVVRTKRCCRYPSPGLSPHGRGATAHYVAIISACGSPPPVRGSRDSPVRVRWPWRSIPARGGRIVLADPSGALISPGSASLQVLGSSPRARGRRGGRRRWSASRRFIPARVRSPLTNSPALGDPPVSVLVFALVETPATYRASAVVVRGEPTSNWPVCGRYSKFGPVSGVASGSARTARFPCALGR